MPLPDPAHLLPLLRDITYSDTHPRNMLNELKTTQQLSNSRTIEIHQEMEMETDLVADFAIDGWKLLGADMVEKGFRRRFWGYVMVLRENLLVLRGMMLTACDDFEEVGRH